MKGINRPRRLLLLFACSAFLGSARLSAVRGRRAGSFLTSIPSPLPRLQSRALIFNSLFSKACVRRRAMLSLHANPNVPKEEADGIMNDVFDSCYSDTYPFMRHPYYN